MGGSSGSSRWLRGLFLTGIGALVLACLLLTLNDLLLSTHRPWNDARLAPAAALLHGYSVYDVAGVGPLLGNAYGPFSPLWFLPAVLMPTPSLAIYVGAVINFLLYALPALLLFRLEAGRQWISLLLGFVCFWLYTFKTPVLTGPAFWIHADAPALGFAALSCACLYCPETRSRDRTLLVAALLAVLAVGTKQPVLPLIVATPAFLWLVEGRRTCLRYLTLLTATGVGAIIAAGLFVDLESMIYNAIVIPYLHPYKGGAAVLDATRELAWRSRLLLPMIGLVVLVELHGVRHTVRGSLREWARRSGWLLPLFVALSGIPISITSRAKEGGAWNTMAPTLYFLLLASLLGVMSVAKRLRSRPLGIPTTTLAKGFFLAFGVALVLGNWPRLSLLPETVGRLQAGPDPEQAAFAFVQANPGEVYLPFRPLVTLMAEGRAYHFSWGIRSYELAGRKVERDHFRAHLPTDLTYVATDRKFDVYALRYLPEFDHEIELSQLPGWRVFSKDPTEGPGRSQR